MSVVVLEPVVVSVMQTLVMMRMYSHVLFVSMFLVMFMMILNMNLIIESIVL